MASSRNIPDSPPRPRHKEMTRSEFELLYREYAPFLLRVCIAFCKDEMLAADMVQDVFCSIWERRGSLMIKGDWEHYFYRCAKYQFYNHQRNVRKGIHLPYEDSEEYLPGDDSTQLDLEYKDLKSNVDGLVGQLPDQCRKVYQMSRADGLKNAEISSMLSLSEKTVKNHLTRALRFLKKNLGVFISFFFTIG